MAPNPHALEAHRRFGVGYHDARIAVNLMVNAGRDRAWAERYVNEVLAARNDLDAAVQSVLAECKLIAAADPPARRV